MEEQTNTMTADISLDLFTGYAIGTATWEETNSVELVKEVRNLSEQTQNLQTSLDNVFYALLFLIAVVGIRVGQGFVQIFKTR